LPRHVARGTELISIPIGGQATWSYA
jgi:hypothetical protein